MAFSTEPSGSDGASCATHASLCPGLRLGAVSLAVAWEERGVGLSADEGRGV